MKLNRSLHIALLTCVLFHPEVFAAKKQCSLFLVSSTQNPQDSSQASTEDHRFLQFVKDLQSFGMTFSETSSEVVKKEFEELSHQNLKRMMRDYDNWLLFNGDKPPKPIKNPDFILWKDLPPVPQALGQNKILSDQEMFKRAWLLERTTFFSELAGSYHGASFVLEMLDSKGQDQVKTESRNRLFLNKNFKTPWMYALPLPGRLDTNEFSYLDNQFLPFLQILAPTLFHEIFEDLKPLLLEGATETDLLTRNLLTVMARHYGTSEPLLKRVRERRSELHTLLLTVEDAALLLEHIQADFKSLMVVVSGSVAAKDYTVSENIPTPLPWTMKLRQGTFGSPNLTSEHFFIPAGPDKKGP